MSVRVPPGGQRRVSDNDSNVYFSKTSSTKVGQHLKLPSSHPTKTSSTENGDDSQSMCKQKVEQGQIHHFGGRIIFSVIYFVRWSENQIQEVESVQQQQVLGSLVLHPEPQLLPLLQVHLTICETFVMEVLSGGLLFCPLWDLDSLGSILVDSLFQVVLLYSEGSDPKSSSWVLEPVLNVQDHPGCGLRCERLSLVSWPPQWSSGSAEEAENKKRTVGWDGGPGPVRYLPTPGQSVVQTALWIRATLNCYFKLLKLKGFCTIFTISVQQN